MRTKRPRDPNELSAAFGTQLKFIAASCEAYDRGETQEALRLASAVYILVHDGGKKERSILTQMGVRASMRFVASGPPYDHANLMAHHSLVGLRVSGSEPAKYIALLGDRANPPRVIQFGEWWERDRIFVSKDKRHSLSRKNLVFHLRSQEGGSHYDEVLTDASYIEMAHGETWVTAVGGVVQPIKDMQLASMRQMAYELTESLKTSGIT